MGQYSNFFVFVLNEVFDFFVTQAGLGHDITDTDCWGRKGTTHNHDFESFKL